MISKEEVYQSLCQRHTKRIQDRFLQGRVAIAGLGGLGSNVALHLTRAGVGHLHLIDYDRVDLSNLNRQQYAMKDIGRYKTEALQEWLTQLNPLVEISISTQKVTEEEIGTLFSEDKIICEAFDKPEEKAMLVDGFFTYCSKDKILVAASGMAGIGENNAIVTRKINPRFYLCGDEESGIETKGSLVSARVALCAAHEANQILEILAKGEMTK